MAYEDKESRPSAGLVEEKKISKYYAVVRGTRILHADVALALSAENLTACMAPTNWKVSAESFDKTYG